MSGEHEMQNALAQQQHQSQPGMMADETMSNTFHHSLLPNTGFPVGSNSGSGTNLGHGAAAANAMQQQQQQQNPMQMTMQQQQPATNRYSYRAAIYRSEAQQDLG